MERSIPRRSALMALGRMLAVISSARALAAAVGTTGGLPSGSPRSSGQAAPRVLDWKELLPAAELGAGLSTPPAIHDYLNEEGPLMQQRGSSAINAALNGLAVRMPGFVVPLELAPNVVVSEFLLVPYYGACIHVPPPPPNQIVYVRLRKPARIRTIWEPYWITGTLNTVVKSTRMAAAAYTLEGDKLEEYRH